MFCTIWRPITLSFLLVLPFALGACVVSESPVSGNRRAYGYSWEQEVQIGQQADSEIISQYGLYDDPQLASYVSEIGQRVLQESHMRRPGTDAKFLNTEFHFRVLDSPVINAFALPGGFVYVTRGLMAHVENEAQLAVVLGHEVAHVAARHSSQRALNQTLGQGALLAGAIGGQAVLGGDTAENILNIGSTAAQFLFLSYGRNDERESDDLGVEYAAMAGYDASQGAGFFETLRRLGEQSGQEIPSFLSTHPDPGEREQTIQRDAAEWAAQLENATEVGRDVLLNQIDGIVYGENPRQGFVQGGMFHHPDLRFSFPVPPGFQVINQPTQVGMVTEDGRAVIVMRIDTQHASARAAADAFAGQEGLSIVEAGQGTANGLSARYVIADAQTTDGQEIRLRAQFIDHGGNVYVFQGMSLRSDFPSYASIFEQTMRGFGPLTDQSLLVVQPSRLEIEQASSTVAFRRLVPGNLPAGVTERELAILNQVELDEQIAAGARYKLVR